MEENNEVQDGQKEEEHQPINQEEQGFLDQIWDDEVLNFPNPFEECYLNFQI